MNLKNIAGIRDIKVYESIYERAEDVARYVIGEKATVRQAAKVFGMSKSSVHKDITERLKKAHSPLVSEVRSVLDTNKEERHIRGGIATKRKFLQLNK